jgi:uncharacterized SAM-dependent methyltransferase
MSDCMRIAACQVDKFRREGLQTELRSAGFDLRHWWTDELGDFSLSLSFSTNF